MALQLPPTQLTRQTQRDIESALIDLFQITDYDQFQIEAARIWSWAAKVLGPVVVSRVKLLSPEDLQSRPLDQRKIELLQLNVELLIVLNSRDKDTAIASNEERLKNYEDHLNAQSESEKTQAAAAVEEFNKISFPRTRDYVYRLKIAHTTAQEVVEYAKQQHLPPDQIDTLSQLTEQALQANPGASLENLHFVYSQVVSDPIIARKLAAESVYVASSFQYPPSPSTPVEIPPYHTFDQLLEAAAIAFQDIPKETLGKLSIAKSHPENIPAAVQEFRNETHQTLTHLQQAFTYPAGLPADIDLNTPLQVLSSTAQTPSLLPSDTEDIQQVKQTIQSAVSRLQTPNTVVSAFVDDLTHSPPEKRKEKVDLFINQHTEGITLPPDQIAHIKDSLTNPQFINQIGALPYVPNRPFIINPAVSFIPQKDIAPLVEIITSPAVTRGLSLAAATAYLQDKQPALSSVEVTQIASQVVDVLEAAHGQTDIAASLLREKLHLTTPLAAAVKTVSVFEKQLTPDQSTLVRNTLESGLSQNLSPEKITDRMVAAQISPSLAAAISKSAYNEFLSPIQIITPSQIVKTELASAGIQLSAASAVKINNFLSSLPPEKHQSAIETFLPTLPEIAALSPAQVRKINQSLLSQPLPPTLGIVASDVVQTYEKQLKLSASQSAAAAQILQQSFMDPSLTYSRLVESLSQFKDEPFSKTAISVLAKQSLEAVATTPSYPQLKELQPTKIFISPQILPQLVEIAAKPQSDPQVRLAAIDNYLKLHVPQLTSIQRSNFTQSIFEQTQGHPEPEQVFVRLQQFAAPPPSPLATLIQDKLSQAGITQVNPVAFNQLVHNVTKGEDINNSVRVFTEQAGKEASVIFKDRQLYNQIQVISARSSELSFESAAQTILLSASVPQANIPEIINRLSHIKEIKPSQRDLYVADLLNKNSPIQVEPGTIYSLTALAAADPVTQRNIAGWLKSSPSLPYAEISRTFSEHYSQTYTRLVDLAARLPSSSVEGQSLKIIAPYLSAQLITDPISTLHNISRSFNYQMVQNLTPLVPLLAHQNTVVYNLHESLTSYLVRQTELDLATVLPAANQIVMFKIAHPTATVDDLKKYTGQFQPYFETRRHSPFNLDTSALSQYLHQFNLKASQTELLRQSLTTQGIRSGLDFSTAQFLATNNFVAATKSIYYLSGFAAPPDASPRRLSLQQKEAMKTLLPPYLQFSPAFNNQYHLLRQFSPEKIDTTALLTHMQKIYGPAISLNPNQFLGDLNKPNNNLAQYFKTSMPLYEQLAQNPRKFIVENMLQRFYKSESGGKFFTSSFGKPIANFLTKHGYNLVSEIGPEKLTWNYAIRAFNARLALNPYTQLGNKIFGKPIKAIAGKIAKSGFGQAVKKAAGGLIAKLGLQALAQTVSTVIAPVIGNLLTFLSGLIIGKLWDATKWAARQLKELLPGLAILGASLFAGFASLAGGTVTTIALAGAAGLAAGFVTNAVIVGGLNVIFNPFVKIAAIVLTPIIIIAVVVPLTVILFAYIINNSAFVVPYSTELLTTNITPAVAPGEYGSPGPSGFPGGGSPPPLPSGIVNASSCPILGGRITNGSYNSSTETGHGSTTYWQAMFSDPKSWCVAWSLPQTTNCKSPTYGPNNVCYQRSGLTRCSYYGYAIDVFAPKRCSEETVYLPKINGQNSSFNYAGGFTNPAGAGYTAYYTDVSGQYFLIMTHINSNYVRGQSLPSGTPVASLYLQGTNGCNAHLHLEVRVNGSYVPPENYFCR